MRASQGYTPGWPVAAILAGLNPNWDSEPLARFGSLFCQDCLTCWRLGNASIEPIQHELSSVPRCRSVENQLVDCPLIRVRRNRALSRGAIRRCFPFLDGQQKLRRNVVP